MTPATFRLSAACAALSALAACTSADDVTPAHGALWGHVADWHISSITASGDAAQKVVMAPTDTSVYYITDLPAGTYTVKFQPTSCYAQPAAQILTVLPGDTTKIADPVVQSRNGLLSWQMVWVAWPNWPVDLTGGCIQATEQAGTLSIHASNSTSPVGGYGIHLELQGFTGAPGSFPMGPNAPARLIHGTPNMPQWQWSTEAAGGSGVVTITAVGANPRRISGTFSASVQPMAGNTGSQTLIRNGTFTDVLY